MKENKKEVESASKDIQTYLSFCLGNETFATNVQKVLNILELKPITKVPHAPEFMRGVINLRGNVLPVIDMRVKFGMERVEATVDTCIIVLNVEISGEEVMLGILVDAVSEVLEIDENKIEPSPSIGTRYKAEFIKGMWRNGEDAFIMLLNIDLIFSTDEVVVLQTKTEEAGEVKES